MVSVVSVPIFGQVGHPFLFVILAAVVVGAFLAYYVFRTYSRRPGP